MPGLSRANRSASDVPAMGYLGPAYDSFQAQCLSTENRTHEHQSLKKGSDAVTAKANPKRQEGMRETIEAVAIAFILAFVFKTFEAEAFVIPTGSMAPTLYGRHKEVTCSGCRIPYTIGASQEVYQDSGVINPEGRVLRSICPNCRLENDVENDRRLQWRPDRREQTGERIQTLRCRGV